jgi:hypothetical protein
MLCWNIIAQEAMHFDGQAILPFLGVGVIFVQFSVRGLEFLPTFFSLCKQM